MASSTITTTTDAAGAIGGLHGDNLVVAGSRLWLLVQTGSNLELWWTDTPGTWSGTNKVTVQAGGSYYGKLVSYNDSGTWRLGMCYAAGGTSKLGFRALHSNVASGTPGSLTTETVIDAGGTNLGIAWPTIAVSSTRLFVFARKQTAASLWESRGWWVNRGTTADTAGNWSTTNFTDIGARSSAAVAGHPIAPAVTTFSGAERMLLVQVNAAGNGFVYYLFDPAATTPTPGSASSTFGSGTFPNDDVTGPMFGLAASPDYVVLHRHNNTVLDLLKFDGSSWTSPTGWSSLTGSYSDVVYTGTGFVVLYTSLTALTAGTAAQMKQRAITPSGNVLSSETTFSDQNGQQVVGAYLASASTVPAVYRGSTGSPYTLYQDSVTLSDMTAPSNPTDLAVTWTAAGSHTVTFTTPSVDDARAYKVVRKAGSQPTGPTDAGATLVVDWTSLVSPYVNQAISINDTGVPLGTAMYYAVYLRDAALNVSTGAFARIVPHSLLAQVSPVSGASVTDLQVPFVWATASGNVEAGKPVFFEVQWTNAAGPSWAAPFDADATVSVAGFEYEASAGSWAPLPTSGLAAVDVGKNVRYTPAPLPAFGSWWWRVRVKEL